MVGVNAMICNIQGFTLLIFRLSKEARITHCRHSLFRSIIMQVGMNGEQ